MSDEVVNPNPTIDAVVPAQLEERLKEMERYKVDMHRFKDETRQLREQNEVLKKTLEKIEVDKLEGNQDHKKLYEMADQRAKEFESKYHSVLSDFTEGKRLDAIKTEALRLGIKEEALEDLDLIDKSAVVVEKTDRGNINILGAKDFVQDLKKMRPFWFNDNKAPTINSNMPNTNVTNKVLTPKEVLKLQKENPEAYKSYILGSRGRL